jgi:GTP cyclohydrolase II
MEKQQISIELTCLFCDCPLEVEVKKECQSGDMLKCQNCQELNDYDALVEVAGEKGLAIFSQQVDEQLDKILSKLNK